MKSLILLTLVTLTLAAVGCANKKNVPKNAAVTDISVAPVPPREPEYAGPLAGAPQSPAYEAPAVTQTPGAATGGGGSYVVRKGDTLFGIAKQTYGNGNQWQRIASANPGLSPGTLKAGQTIVLP
jgi:5'-nucleotidase / UDP-sugar diphosphatase